MLTGDPQIIHINRLVDAEIDHVLLLNATFYSNDDNDVSVEWLRVDNMSSTPIPNGHQRYNISIAEKDVAVNFRTIPVMLPGNITQLAISPVQSEDFTVFEVRITNTAGTAVSSVSVVPKGYIFISFCLHNFKYVS